MKYLKLILCVVIMFISSCKEDSSNTIYVFSQPGCGHCINAHNYMQRYYKNYDIKEINIHEGNNMNKLYSYAKKHKIPNQKLGTPLIIMGNEYILGWGNEQTKAFNRNIKKYKPITK